MVGMLHTTVKNEFIVESVNQWI